MPLHLEPIVCGNAEGETLVFVQGWPDDLSLWDGAVGALAPTYRCVRTNFPNYGEGEPTRWGATTEEIVDALVRLFREVAVEKPITLVLHDWGSYWGHAAHRRCPEIVARIATLDVAPHYEPGPIAALGIVAYQSWLLAAFVLGGRVGTSMTRSFAKRNGAPAPVERIDARMNYPYRNIWVDLATGRRRKLEEGYFPSCPLLFVYGEKKPFPFHSKAWTDHVKKTGGDVVALPCGHWVPVDPGFVDVLSRWLRKTDSLRSA